jgi:hypothetical protein
MELAPLAMTRLGIVSTTALVTTILGENGGDSSKSTWVWETL